MVSLSAALVCLSGHVVTVLPTAGSPSPSPRDFNDDNVQPGPVPLAVITILLLASWLLVRSMRTHLKRIPADLDVQLRAGNDSDPANPPAPEKDSQTT
ncbi:MAG: hypothetical protein EB027_04475 [Actinobacteria bacterium]|nr:hypothetical protein [Actinomycetota bacterium]